MKPNLLNLMNAFYTNICCFFITYLAIDCNVLGYNLRNLNFLFRFKVRDYLSYAQWETGQNLFAKHIHFLFTVGPIKRLRISSNVYVIVLLNKVVMGMHHNCRIFVVLIKSINWIQTGAPQMHAHFCGFKTVLFFIVKPPRDLFGSNGKSNGLSKTPKISGHFEIPKHTRSFLPRVYQKLYWKNTIRKYSTSKHALIIFRGKTQRVTCNETD
ncbi:hypothetical protein ACJX0J_039090 [Zea mays]